MTADIEQQARELLAAECPNIGRDMLVTAGGALRAIVAALRRGSKPAIAADGSKCTLSVDQLDAWAANATQQPVQAAPHYIEEKALEVAKEIYGIKAQHRAQYVAGIQIAVTKAMQWAAGGSK